MVRRDHGESHFLFGTVLSFRSQHTRTSRNNTNTVEKFEVETYPLRSPDAQKGAKQGGLCYGIFLF